MGRWRSRRRSAYYGRNQSYSRSYNAERAEDSGRLPRTRAASRLGVSVKAFDAGCEKAGYRSTEWHHVGKYANMVDYYDTEELEASWKFWVGARSAYSGKAKKKELLAKASAARRNEQEQDLPVSKKRFMLYGSENWLGGAFRVMPVNGRFFKVLDGPGFPPGAIVDKSMFNDFRMEVWA